MTSAKRVFSRVTSSAGPIVAFRFCQFGLDLRLFGPQFLDCLFRLAGGAAQGGRAFAGFGPVAPSGLAVVDTVFIVAAGGAPLFGQQAAVVVEVAVERCAGAVGDQPQTVADQFEQMRVVADQDNRALIFVQSLDQGLAGVDVQMVGRFVQQHQVRGVEAHQGEQQTRLFTAGKIGDPRVGTFLAEPEAADLSADLGLVRSRHQRGHVAVGGSRDVQFLDLVLGEIADAQLARHAHAALHRFQTLGQQLDQGRLAVAVGPDQGDAVVHVDAQVEARENRLVCDIADRRAFHTDQRRGRLSGLGNEKETVCASMADAIGSIRSSIFMRLWAWRALLAL